MTSTLATGRDVDPGATTCSSDENPNGRDSGDDSDEASRRVERTAQKIHSNDGDESNSRTTGASTDDSVDGC